MQHYKQILLSLSLNLMFVPFSWADFDSTERYCREKVGSGVSQEVYDQNMPEDESQQAEYRRVVEQARLNRIANCIREQSNAAEESREQHENEQAERESQRRQLEAEISRTCQCGGRIINFDVNAAVQNNISCNECPKQNTGLSTGGGNGLRSVGGGGRANGGGAGNTNSDTGEAGGGEGNAENADGAKGTAGNTGSGGKPPCETDKIEAHKQDALNAVQRAEAALLSVKNQIESHDDQVSKQEIQDLYAQAQTKRNEAQAAADAFSTVDCNNKAEELLGTAQRAAAAITPIKESIERAQTKGIEREEKRVSREYDGQFKTCEKARMVADECCSRPESCLTKPDGEMSQNDGMAGDAIKMLMGMAAGFPAGSASAMCGKMKTIANISTGINAYLAQRCSHYVSQCKKQCQPPSNLKNELSTCGTSDINSKTCDLVTAQEVRFKDEADECMQMDNQSMRLAAQAVGAQLSAKFADMCKDQFEAQKIAEEEIKPEDLFANTNCANPTAQTMSFCQTQCSRPGAQQDPNCAAFLGLNNNNGFTPTTAGNNDGLFDDLNADESGEQKPVFDDIQARANSSTGVAGGGGGGMLGGSGAPGGDSGGGGQGGYDAGHNTKIDRGLASGNGYSSGGGRMMSGAGGGFSGYGRGAITNNNGKGVNLKDFLPGRDAKASPFRGLASVARDISPAHDDIFKKVTSRFYQLCLRDALYDCATIKKLKAGGN